MTEPLYAPPRTDLGRSATLLPAEAAYTIRRPFFSFLDRTFRVTDGAGNLVALVRRPLLRLKEAFFIYADEAQQQPLAGIQARKIIAINPTYDVTDPSGAWLGTLREKGLRSILRDTWDVLDEAEQPLGLMEEEGWSLLRRMFPLLVGRWHVVLGGREVARVDQVFRFFVKEYRLSVHAAGADVDPRFLLACALLALMRENRREERD